MTSTQYHYERMAIAINYLKENFRQQPSLEEVAAQVHLSPFHFQRLFTEWAGVSPKKFTQFLSIEYAKKLLQQPQATLFDTAHETGLSGTGRLHDLFVNIEGMTPGEFKNGGEKLSINYSFAECRFGRFLVAATAKGVCHLAFFQDKTLAFSDLCHRFPNAQFQQMTDVHQQNTLHFFSQFSSDHTPLQLHLKGTAFQLKVWQALLQIPSGGLTTYGKIATTIHQPKASRAVGTAIGNNPIAYLIPCHRVIRATGEWGNYRWGKMRKTAMIGWEAANLT